MPSFTTPGHNAALRCVPGSPNHTSTSISDCGTYFELTVEEPAAGHQTSERTTHNEISIATSGPLRAGDIQNIQSAVTSDLFHLSREQAVLSEAELQQLCDDFVAELRGYL